MDEEYALVTFQSFTTTFTDFLCVAIHTILYERNIYPRTTFLSAKKYNFSVRQNRHPRVCKYILDAVAAVEVELLRGAVQRVVVVVLDGRTDVVLERFVFDVGGFPFVPAEYRDTPLRQRPRQQQTQGKQDGGGGVEGEDDQGIYILPLVDLEEQLRGTMSRLSDCGSRLKPIPEGCTFAVVIELKDEGRETAPLGHPQPWIPVQPRSGRLRDGGGGGGGGGEGQENQIGKTTPVRNVEAGYMIFETWIDESKAKFDLVDESSLESRV